MTSIGCHMTIMRYLTRGNAWEHSKSRALHWVHEKIQRIFKGHYLTHLTHTSCDLVGMSCDPVEISCDHAD